MIVSPRLFIQSIGKSHLFVGDQKQILIRYDDQRVKEITTRPVREWAKTKYNYDKRPAIFLIYR